MKGEYKQPRPGEVFYYLDSKLHYIGCAESEEDKVHVLWGWNEWKKRRYYEVYKDEVFKIFWSKFLTKNKL